MNDEQQAVQLTIDQAEAKIEFGNKVEKLLNNDLFKEVVTESYLREDAIRLTMGLKPDSEKNEVANNMLIAKAMFSRYIGNALEEKEMAQNTLSEHLQMQAEG